MRLAVVNNTVPFLRGGAEVLADSLVAQLRRAGHVADLVRLPFAWQPVERIADSMLAASLTRIEGVDRVIALKFPAYYVPHDDKVLWLLHQFRQFYELWDDQAPSDLVTDEVRSMVHRADDACFAGARKLFTNSEVTAERLRRHNGFTAEVLFPPLPDPSVFENLGYGDYVFAGGRINSFKRQLLAVQAMKYTTSDVRLIVAGQPETSDDLAQIDLAREQSGCADRIIVIPQFIEERHKIEFVNRSLAVVYSPVDEDSYGYVTLEGAQARKPLITTTDSGGILNLVIDGRSGLVVEPEPAALGAAFDRLHRSAKLTETLGDGAYERMLDLGISWDHVLDRLLS